MQQYRQVKAKYPDTILLFRMGDFFETFEEDAKITARVLGIVLTKRETERREMFPLPDFRTTLSKHTCRNCSKPDTVSLSVSSWRIRNSQKGL